VLNGSIRTRRPSAGGIRDHHSGEGRSGTISVVGSKIIVPALFALLIGGCPKRQTTPRIVYVQPPPAATQASASAAANASAGTLTIQEPETETADEVSTPAPQTTPAPPPATARKSKPPRAASRDTGEKPPPENNQPVPESQPAPLQLQPQGGDVQEAVISRRLDELEAEVEDLRHRTGLSLDQQRAANDAAAFRNQALDALRQHDLLRAKQLTDKAALLINAVLEQH
jgi:hypothetical protein